MKTITVTEASRNFSELISRIHYRGEAALLTKGGRPMARLLPARRGQTGRELAEAWESMPHLMEEDAAAFGADLEQSRRDLPDLNPKWD